MGNFIKSKELILLLDNFSESGKDLYHSFCLTEKEFLPIVIEDDGFLPEDVISVYGYFLGDFKEEAKALGRPRYFNQVTIPEFWEIRGTNNGGSIYDHSKERGKIFYADPKHKRLIKIIDWYDERGVVRSSDHYNCYGALYARTVFNSKGQRVNKSYFAADGTEVIVENYVTGNIILNYKNKIIIFQSKPEFIAYFFKEIEASNSRICFNSLSIPFFVSQKLDAVHKKDVLIWQEGPRNDIPGNMKFILDKAASRTEKIGVQNQESYDKLIALGANPDMVFKLGNIYPFKRENQGRKQVLICTNSDRIESLARLVNAFPELHFHIAAITEMSSRLMSMGNYDNVSLYPGVKESTLEELFTTCDFYFDINYENEIMSAIKKAFLQNQLIFAFEETVHNKMFVAREHIFSAKDVESMIEYIKQILSDEEELKKHLQVQKDAAGTENKESFIDLIMQ